MQIRPTLGDTFTKAQLRIIENSVKADQRQGLPLRILRKLEEHRQNTAKDNIAEVRRRVQWERHKKQNGLWKNRKPYMTQEEAYAIYDRKLAKIQERKEARSTLENGSRMFSIGKGTCSRRRVRDHVGEKTGSLVHVVRFDNSYITITCKSKRTY